jgi:hypothetical protein
VTSAEMARWKRSQQCLQRVAEGLRDIPALEAATEANLTAHVLAPSWLYLSYCIFFCFLLFCLALLCRQCSFTLN